jgi:integrase/recombinase XerD
VAAFRAAVRLPLHQVTAVALQDYADGMQGAPATRAQRLAAIKSLYSYAHTTGYLQARGTLANVATAISLPTVRNDRAARIMSESDMLRLLAAADSLGDRHSAIVRTLYSGGFRISELAGIRWCDLTDRGDGRGQISVHGKGGKGRVVLVYGKAWQKICALQHANCKITDYVFGNASGGQPVSSTIHRIVKQAVSLAGLPETVSAHWLRHAHASHSLDRGAPIATLQATLGHESLVTTSRYVHARPGESSGMRLPE